VNELSGTVKSGRVKKLEKDWKSAQKRAAGMNDFKVLRAEKAKHA
jgi:hypothetical protein